METHGVSLAQIRLGMFIHFYSPGSHTDSLGSFWDLLTHSCHPLGMHMKFPCRRHLKNIPIIELSYGFRDRFKSLHHPPASAHTHTGTDTHSYLSGCCASISASLQHCIVVILHLCDSIIDYQCLEQENLYFLHFFFNAVFTGFFLYPWWYDLQKGNVCSSESAICMNIPCFFSCLILCYGSCWA